MSDGDDNVRSFVQSRRNIARLQKLVRELAQDSTQVRIAVQGLGQGVWSDVSEFDVLKLLRRCTLESSLERVGKGEWRVRAIGNVGGASITAVTMIVYRSWLIVTEVERNE